MNRFGVVILCTLLAAGLGGRAAVVINEIHHSPDIEQEPVSFVEVYNSGAQPVDLTGWRFNAGIQFDFPPGVILDPGGYRVVAANPGAVQAKFGIAGVLGPWTGSLSGRSDTLRLVQPNGVLEDEVDYQLGFPWPTVGDAPGYSIELIHPDLDNSLGGNWRVSVVGGAIVQEETLIRQRARWSFRRGTQEASQPISAWRQPEYNDGAWETGALPIGYDPDIAFGTPLTDMRVDGTAQYITVYLRTRFQLTQADQVHQLKLNALYDDGFKLWINGRLLLSQNMDATELAFDQDAQSTRESNSYEPFEISVPSGVLKDGENVIAVQLANGNNGVSSDCFFDCQLKAVQGGGQRGPTPGRINVAWATNAPSAIRQVQQVPTAPRSGTAVQVRARVTDPDGVGSVQLLYQSVDPGQYIELGTPAYATNWTVVAMKPGADPEVFEATLPAEVQRHRRLIRYRIVATDALGLRVQAPYSDDPQPNFAYFVYDGVPAWTGAIQPSSAGALAKPFTVSTAEMNRLPVIHLLATRDSVEACTWRDRSHGDEYFCQGTLVFDGVVYDHIRMRPRGGVWRYAMGKNMWKFDFNRGHELRMRDNYGRLLDTAWGKLNLGACIQQGDFLHRGEQGMFESVGFRLFQLAGVPAMNSTFLQFRIVDDAVESNPADQYGGDFWGLYLALEQPDGRFLDAHGLPDGNFYKMEGGFGDPNNLGPQGPTDSSDLLAFLTAYGGNNYQTLTETWWRTNMNLPTYYSYQTIVQAIHHYDIGDGKNYYFYRDPRDNRWMTIPWDLDLTWADNMYRGGQFGDSPNGGGEPFKLRVFSDFHAEAQFPAIQREFKNRVREIRDLLWNSDQTGQLIQELAIRLRGTNGFTLLDADRAQWDYNPLMIDSSLVNLSKAGHGRFYQSGVGSKDFEGMLQKMRNYIVYRATNPTYSLDTISTEPDRPAKPTLQSIGAAGFPGNRLEFRASEFSGAGAFASVKFRLAEVTRTNGPVFNPAVPWAYEIEPVWETREILVPTLQMAIPAGTTKPGHTYRARVRYTDTDGRTSNWSEPVEFVAGASDKTLDLVQNLRLSELMYNPPADGFEFIELKNLGNAGPLDLAGVQFTTGIDFTFPEGSVLPAGGYAVVVRTDPTNFPGFRAYHGLAVDFPLYGPYSGSLDNGGETLTLKTEKAGVVLTSFAWSDQAPWPVLADGGGYSLTVKPAAVNAPTAPDLNLPDQWMLSTEVKGTPGRPDASLPELRFSQTRLTSRGFEGHVDAAVAIRYVLQVSSDLLEWQDEAEYTGAAEFVVPTPVNREQRFVRALVR